MQQSETRRKIMKSKSMILAALASAILVTGCKQSNTAGENTTSDTNVTSTAESIKEGATNAWANTKYAATNAWADVKESLGSTADYTYDKKDEFVTNAQADLDALDQKIQALAGKTDAILSNKRAEMDQKLTDVKNATQDNWNNAKTAFKYSYDDLKNSIKQNWNGSVTNGTTGGSMTNRVPNFP
jgi:peptidoglycan hydrolase CwlO-like protein